MSKLKLNCREANHVCDKNQYKEASFWEKVKLNIHLVFCMACRKYSTNNAKLSKLFKASKIEALDPRFKEELKTSFDKELAKHQ